MSLGMGLIRTYCFLISIIWIMPCQWVNEHLANLCIPSFHTSGLETLQSPAKALDNRICASAKSESKTNPYLVILNTLKHSNSFSSQIGHAEERNWSITEICYSPLSLLREESVWHFPVGKPWGGGSSPGVWSWLR